MKKEEIRPRVKAWKAVLTDAEKAEAARAAFAMLERHAAFMMAENILMYHSLPDEISTHDFIDRWAGRKRFYLPRVNGVNLDILPFERTSLHLRAFSIEEPDGDDPTDISEIELIVVPGVAYDPEGNRVGRGKGYYDRLLAGARATKIGIAYDFQVVDSIEAEPHDVRVDVVITDRRIFTPRKRK